MKVAIVLFCLVASVTAAPGNGRIVGGENAADGQFPYQVSVRSYGRHTCGGSILDETTILCAAHCVTGSKPIGMTIRVGNNKLNEQTEEYKVAKVIYHEVFNSWDITNDISIIKLASPIQFRAGVVEVTKLRRSDIGVEPVTLSGWGSAFYHGAISNELKFINLNTISIADCKARHSGHKVIGSEVCTFTQAGEGACQGDSGGPLVDANQEQVGIVSWGKPCALGYPDVYTRVYSFLDWIEKNRV